MARKLTSGRFSDPELLILSSLAQSRKHGYAVMQDIVKFAGVNLGAGTLYTAISRLVEREWIEPCGPASRQRTYQITQSGIRHLEAQLAEMRRLANFGLRRLRDI